MGKVVDFKSYRHEKIQTDLSHKLSTWIADAMEYACKNGLDTDVAIETAFETALKSTGVTPNRTILLELWMSKIEKAI